MKNFLVLLAVLSLISFSACSQKNPPENVKKVFAQKFVAAKSVKWDSEKSNEWEAEFKLNGKEMSACFDNAGKWLETESEISLKELPASVTNTLKNDFQGYKTDEMSTIENPEIKGFELTIKKGEMVYEIVIDTTGKVIKKTEMKEENEKDEKN
jgi:hypothetical protein